MKKLAIGIDIGGINTAFGLVDENGDLYADSVVSTKKFPLFTDYPAYVAELTESLHALADSLSFEYELVGIACSRWWTTSRRRSRASSAG